MQSGTNPFAGLPTVVKNLLIINGILFLVKLTNVIHIGDLNIDDLLALHFFSSPLFKPWQLVTHIFVHRDFGHVFFNMLGLFMLGPALEYKWGSKRFLTYYMVTGVGASLLYSGVHALEYHQLFGIGSGLGRSVLFSSLEGASGAIYGVLLAFGMTYPNTELILFPIPIPIKAKYFVLMLGAFSVYSALRANPNDHVAHLAHLGGMLVGYILIRLWRGRGGGNQFGWDR